MSQPRRAARIALFMCLQFEYVLLLLLVAAVELTCPASAVSSLPLVTVSVPAHSFSQPFASVSFPGDVNTVVLGVTVQVPVEDCDQSSRWSFRESNLLATGFNFSLDRRVCAVFIFPSDPTVAVTVSGFVAEMRKLWYFNNRAEPVSSSLLSPIRLAWNYWVSQRYLVSDATNQHAFYCLPREGVFLAYFDAATACNLWMQDPTDPTAVGATLASPYSAQVEWLIDHQRATYSETEADILTGQTIGHVTYVGLFGNKATWDNGLAVSYRNWAPSNPTGAFPTVLDQFTTWKSVVTQEAHAYCCETSGIGSIQASQNGMVASKPVTTSASIPSNTGWTMDITSPAQFPFRFVYLDSAAVTFGKNVTGFVAGIHPEDCDGALRFIVAAEVIAEMSAKGLTAEFDVQLCSLRFMWKAASGGSGVNASVLIPFVRTIRLMAIRTIDISRLKLGGDVEDLGFASSTVRLLWSFTYGDNTSWVIAHYPVPHLYQCFFDSKNYEEADDACADLSAGLNEAYLMTPQYAWEQNLLEALQSRVTFNDDAWFGLDRLRGSNVFANGDPILNGFTNWAVNQPSSAKLPARASASDGKWFSAVRVLKGSYCCEWNTVPSRSISGAVNVSLRILSLGVPHKDTFIGYKAYQTLRVFRNLSSFVHPELRAPTTLVFGVTMKLENRDCKNGQGYRMTAPSGVVRQGFAFCPSSSSNCNHAVLLESCMWYLRTTNGSAVPATAFLEMMSDLVVHASSRILYEASVPFGWAFWGNASVTLGPIVIGAQSGVQMACAPDGGGGVTYIGAMEQCRFWHGDGFLASILSPDEQLLLELARKIANGFSRTSLGNRNAWIGLDRNSSHWSNGDAKDYQNWMAGQPDKTGPTQSGPSGTWTNVPHASSETSLPTALFCCKRNGFNQLSSVFGGIVRMRGPTFSVSLTLSNNGPTQSSSRTPVSPTDDATRTMTQRETRTVPAATETPTFTNSVSNAAASRTLSLLVTTSVPHTTPPVTRSLSDPQTATRSQSVPTVSSTLTTTVSHSHPLTPTRGTRTETLSVSVALPPIARIDLVSPASPSSTLVFSPRDLRAGQVRIVVEAVFTHFLPVSSNAYYFNNDNNDGHDGVMLTVDPSSPSVNLSSKELFTVAAIGAGRRLLSTSSFVVDLSQTVLTVQLNPVRSFDPPATEVLQLSFNRSITNITPGYPPLEGFQVFRLTINKEDVEPGVAPKVLSSIFGALALGAPGAFRDQQVLYLLGRHHCAKPYMRGVFLSGQRVVSPASWREDSYTSQWTGAAVFIGAGILVNIFLLVRVIFDPQDYHHSSSVPQQEHNGKSTIFSRAYFPSIAVLVSMWMHVSVTFFSIRLIQRNDNPAEHQSLVEMALGGTGLAYSGLVTLGILLWTWRAAPTMRFETYDEAALHHVHWLHRPFMPFGRWASAEHRDGLGWIAGEYRLAYYAGAEWLFGWFFTWFVSYRPDTVDQCILLYLVLGFVALLLAAIVAAFRPFRSLFLNFCSCASFLCLCVILGLSAAQVTDPDGLSQGAQLVFRWILVFFTVGRSAGNVLFLSLERNLITAELDSFEKERWRQMHALKKNSIYFQSQFLQRAHDDVAERREEARMASELESIQRFNSVAFDSSKPIPFSRRESVQITPGYKFPTSFRNAGGVGVGRESITADIGTRALDEDFPENSPSSYSRRRSSGGGGKISFPLDEDLPAIPAKEYSFSSSRARGLVPKDDARRLSSSKAISGSNIKQHRYSMQVVESESDSREDSSWDDDEELYDPFDAVDADNGQRRASSAGGRGVQHVNQGMYRNSMLYRRESVAPAAAAAAGDGWLQQPKFSTAAGVSPRSMDDAAVQRRASQGERSLFSGRSLTSAPPNAASHSYAKSPSARVSFFMPSTQGNGSTTNNKKISRSAVGDTNNHHVRRSSNQDSAGRRGVDQRRNDVDEEDYRGGGGLQFSPRSPVASGGGNPPLWSSSSHRKRESPDRIGSGRLSVSELADSSAAVREARQRVQGQATRTRWDSTVRLMLRERAKSSSGILSLDDDDPDL